MKIFLDLEETVIESWDNPLLMNVGRLRQFLEEHNVRSVGIFSFAIWNDEDREKFSSSGMKHDIAQALNVVIDEILTIPEVAETVFWKKGTTMSVTEFITIWGKQRAFIDWALLTQKGHVVLVDDVVHNLTIENRDTGVKVELFNVNNIV